jgi:DNA polymerase III delta prime subunit
MDTRTKININTTQLISANSHHTLINFTKKYLQEIFCKSYFQNNHKEQCLICKQISVNQYHNILWLSTESTYKLQDIDTIFEKISLSLDENEQFFFIIENAHLLNVSCSNKLLKIVEEPPPGYNFIFLTQRPQDILETIKSRCVNLELKSSYNISEEPLLKYFTTKTIDAPDFLYFIDRLNITEQQTIIILDDILKFWIDHDSTDKKISIIVDAFKNLPNQGGSKLFWKNLFTKFYKDGPIAKLL